jgi:methylenetetrahydrofolate reductase (NADPH)
MTATDQPGLLARAKAGQFIITTEIVPPTSLDPSRIEEKFKPLVGLVDGVNMTDGASARAAMDPLAACAIALRSGVTPIMQLTCRDRNRIALQAAIIGSAALGVRHFLCLTGDDPTTGDQPETKGVFDINSAALMKTVVDVGNGALPSGRSVSGAVPLVAGCADMPIDPADDWEPKALKDKIASGATFAQTQFCMDPAMARRYVAHLHARGVPEDFAILIGVAPLVSAKSARWIRENLFGSIIPDSIVDRLDAAADPAEEGRAIARDVIAELAGIKGVAGVHIMAPMNEKSVPALVEAVRKAL